MLRLRRAPEAGLIEAAAALYIRPVLDSAGSSEGPGLPGLAMSETPVTPAPGRQKWRPNRFSPCGYLPDLPSVSAIVFCQSVGPATKRWCSIASICAFPAARYS